MSIEEHTVIAAGSTEVWCVLCDIESWPDWLPTVDRAVREPGPESTAVGTAYAVTQPRLGTARWVVTQWVPGASFTWESRRPGVVTVGTHVIASTGQGCTVTLGIRWTGPLATPARLAYGRLTRRNVQQEADALRRRVEAG